MFPLWFALLSGSFVFLDIGPSILFLVFPFLGALVNLRLAGFHQKVGHWGTHLFLFCNWGPKRCFYSRKCLMLIDQSIWLLPPKKKKKSKCTHELIKLNIPKTPRLDVEPQVQNGFIGYPKLVHIHFIFEETMIYTSLSYGSIPSLSTHIQEVYL